MEEYTQKSTISAILIETENIVLDVHRNTSTSNGHEIILHGISRSYKNGSGYAGLDKTCDTYWMGWPLGNHLQDSENVTFNQWYSSN